MISQARSAKHCIDHADYRERKANKRKEGEDDDDDELFDDRSSLKLAADEMRREAKLHSSSVTYHAYRVVQVI
jgi:hypothetical protein